MKMYHNILNVVLAVALSSMMFSCRMGNQDTGWEYASQMYHSRAYEPLTQVVDTSDKENYNSNPYNQYGMNMRKTAPNTVKIRNFNPLYYTQADKDLMIYHVTKDSAALAARTLKNPLPNTPEIVAQGEELYGRYCKHCHGAQGKGDGKVGVVFQGVPSYKSVADRTEGSIFHTITYGKNRMGAHGSQVSVEDRWKIVRFVQTLQAQ